MNKKFLLILLMSIVSMAESVAENYDINIAGVEVTSSNANYITGGGITSGYGVYNASTNTLSLYNISINRSGQDNYGIHNRKRDNLTIVFNGYCNIITADNALKLERSTTLTAAAGSETTFYSAARICANLKSYTYYIKGTGKFSFLAQQSAYEAIKGDGRTNTTVNFNGPKIKVYSTQRSAISSFKAIFNTGNHLEILNNGSNTSVSDVAMTFNGREAVVSPYKAFYNDYTVKVGNTAVSNKDIIITDDYVAILASPYFPDQNFCDWLYGAYFSKGYINSTDVTNTTALEVNNSWVTSIDGVGYFSNLKTLKCTAGGLTSLPSLPSSLTYLDCSGNSIPSLPGLSSNIEYLNVSGNNFTELSVTNKPNLKTLLADNCIALTSISAFNNALTSISYSGDYNLKNLYLQNNKLTYIQTPTATTINLANNLLTTLPPLWSTTKNVDVSNNKIVTLNLSNISDLQTLNVSNNTLLTTLNCYSNALTSLNVTNCTALTTLNCYGNALPSLTLTGCSALKTLDCHSNQITTFVSLPTSVQTFYCNDNRIGYGNTGVFDLSGRTALKILDVKNNPNIKELNCGSCSLTSLNVSGCSAMTKLDCSFNLLTSLDVSSLSNLTEFRGYYNKLTSLNLSNKTKLTTAQVVNNQLTSLNVSGCTALQQLVCGENKLSSLSVQGCNALRELNCYGNQIRESAMNSLVSSLCTIPAGSSGEFLVIYPGLSSGGYTEGNVITDAQVMAARNKRWMPKKWNGNYWVDIPVNTAVPGDVNGDGHVSSADVTALYDHLLNNDSSNIVNGDVDGDGHITSGDITAVYSIMLGQ